MRNMYRCIQWYQGPNVSYCICIDHHRPGTLKDHGQRLHHHKTWSKSTLAVTGLTNFEEHFSYWCVLRREWMGCWGNGMILLMVSQWIIPSFPKHKFLCCLPLKKWIFLLLWSWHLYILVGGFNPSEKYDSQLGLLFPIYGNKYSKPPTSIYIYYNSGK